MRSFVITLGFSRLGLVTGRFKVDISAYRSVLAVLGTLFHINLARDFILHACDADVVGVYGCGRLLILRGPVSAPVGVRGD